MIASVTAKTAKADKPNWIRGSWSVIRLPRIGADAEARPMPRTNSDAIQGCRAAGVNRPSSASVGARNAAEVITQIRMTTTNTVAFTSAAKGNSRNARADID